MGELETNEELNNSLIENQEDIVDDSKNEEISTPTNECDDSNIANDSTAITEYKEVDEPCVSLTIIGENRLTDAEVFIRRGFRYSIKAFFSAIVLTIINMFI